MKLEREAIAGLRVTIMGLGLHGGGVASAAFFASHGAEVTVTDLRSEAELASSIERLSALPLRYVLGRHEMDDFASADIVVKNPAVPPGSPYLQAARRVESDISVFLSLASNPVIAVTGTKGKSTTASAVHHVLAAVDPHAKLGGNITVSPLTFVDELEGAPPQTPVVLELSSWQLADLRGKGVLRPKVAVVTNILRDHMNRYPGMDEYVADKMVIVSGQRGGDFTVCNLDDPYHGRFAQATSAAVRYFSRGRLPEGLDGAWLEGPERVGKLRREGGVATLLSGPLRVPGEHNRLNLLAAGLALASAGTDPQKISAGLASFPGIRHRLEFVDELEGRRFYNDSAATIPEATLAAVASFDEPPVLIAGGTDKELDFAPFGRFPRPPKTIVLLEGSATAKLAAASEAAGIDLVGPCASLDAALSRALERSDPGDVILFSPGCASFEMFKNEFDRGDNFVQSVEALRHSSEH